MALHPLAGKPAPRDVLVNVPRLISAYYTYKPDPSDPANQVAFGTSGHRGSSLKNSFNEDHILAISQALCEHRHAKGITGPLFVGMDTHALSEPAQATAVEVFAANGVTVMIQTGFGYTPTPVISHAILTTNRGRSSGLADGVVITPSHNPPDDGGFKYNPPDGGPADTSTTQAVQDRANEIMRNGMKDVKRLPFEKALKADTTHFYDYVTPYVSDLKHVVDMQAIAASGLKIGVDPLGGASVGYWDPIVATYGGLNVEVVNRWVDPTFSFMTVDKDGKIRMDCSSPYAMASLIELKDRFEVAFGNDPDADRHGIVTPSVGLDEPQPLPGGSDLVPLPEPAWLAGRRSRGQDAGVQLDDRPCGLISGSQAGRGAGGFQMVRGWPGRRLLWLRRRGERGRFVLAQRWHGLDHR